MNKITPRGPLGLKADKPTRQETNGLDTDYLSVVADALAGELNGG